MKKTISAIVSLLFMLSLASCSYNPPEGWTKEHHTYAEISDFAKSIDKNATVSTEYIDTTDKNDRKYREWNAVINNVECHVTSVYDYVWNDGFLAGEFPQAYYRIDTDYDYIVFANTIAESGENWIFGQSIRNRYNSTINANLFLPEYRMLNDDELENIWDSALKIYVEYENHFIKKTISLGIPSPGKYWDQSEDSWYILKHSSYTYIKEFTDEGKEKFFQEYYDDWNLLKSGLPIRD